MVKSFHYNHTIISALEASLSSDRLTAYMQATGGNMEHALRLYIWNTAMSAALYGPLQGLEIALRNAMHRELSNLYGTQWYDNSGASLSPQNIDRVGKAKATIARGRKPVTASRVVAELSFGFWVSLLGPGPSGGYEMKLWRPALYKAFPHAKLPRKGVHGPLDRLRTLRNRIAHHEPIFQRRLEKDYRRIIEIISWICADTAAWVSDQSTFSNIIATRP